MFWCSIYLWGLMNIQGSFHTFVSPSDVCYYTQPSSTISLFSFLIKEKNYNTTVLPQRETKLLRLLAVLILHWDNILENFIAFLMYKVFRLFIFSFSFVFLKTLFTVSCKAKIVYFFKLWTNHCWYHYSINHVISQKHRLSL